MHAFFHTLRHQIRSREHTPASLRHLFDDHTRYRPGRLGQIHRSYDALDALVQGLMHAEREPEALRPLDIDMVHYEPTPARAILDLIDQVSMTAHDVFYDLGSGLGHVVISVHLLTGATAKGVEIEASYCEHARRCADELGLLPSQVQFWHGDASAADYSDGTVFFMYTPFTGKLLATVLKALAQEAQRRPITVCTHGACTFDVAQQPWLQLRHPEANQAHALAVFNSNPTQLKSQLAMTTPTHHHIAIWGVGALGSLFAGYLSAVADVTMVGHWPEQIDAVQREGLAIHHANGQVTQSFPAITADPASLPPTDLMIVLVKSHQTAAIAPAIANALSPNGVVITLQNGVGNLDTLVNAVGAERATQGVTAQGANFVGLGAVRHAGMGLTHIAVLPERASLIETCIALLNQTGIETHATDSADSLVWGKLAVNAGLNPLTALLDLPNGELLTEPRRKHFMIEAAREVEAVAAAQGIQLPYPDVAAQVEEVARVTGPNISSMLQDMRRRVPTEIDAMCGAVVRYGERHRVPTPINSRLLELIRARENGQAIAPEAVYQALSQVV